MSLRDGDHDAIVIDAAQVDDVIVIDLTILSGEHKGDVVTIRARAGALGMEPLDMLGVPATITVTGGVPSLALEP